jgi:hypothetical protein
MRLLRSLCAAAAIVAFLATAVQAPAEPSESTPPGTANTDYAEVEPLLVLGEIEVVSREVRAGRPLTIRLDVSAPAKLTARVGRETVLVVSRQAGSNTLRLPADALPKPGRHRLTVVAETDSGQSAGATRRLTARR